MKLFFKIVVLFILLQSFQCSDSNEPSVEITASQLDAKKQEIQNYINSFSCSESVGCSLLHLAPNHAAVLIRIYYFPIA